MPAAYSTCSQQHRLYSSHTEAAPQQQLRKLSTNLSACLRYPYPKPADSRAPHRPASASVAGGIAAVFVYKPRSRPAFPAVHADTSPCILVSCLYVAIFANAGPSCWSHAHMNILRLAMPCTAWRRLPCLPAPCPRPPLGPCTISLDTRGPHTRVPDVGHPDTATVILPVLLPLQHPVCPRGSADPPEWVRPPPSMVAAHPGRLA